MKMVNKMMNKVNGKMTSPSCGICLAESEKSSNYKTLIFFSYFKLYKAAPNIFKCSINKFK